ncbi:hypothetical protein [Alteromonas antoniana]|uniref:hypothetical protein n=1 Tax=Alteromonas antoniana TaxID=2803813 RepID=UPI001C437977|nr:hypothetical protein [Alteromonas antoniana]
MNSKQLIWIGAGTATAPEFNFDNYASVTLIEAREAACRELSALFQHSENVTVKHCCVSVTGKESKFFTCNVEEFSALARPAELKTLYPGLKVEDSSELETVPIDELIEQETKYADLELFIDIPATAGELVRKLDGSGVLERVTKLHVTAGSDLLYEESLSITSIKELLDGYFLTETARDESDPDIPTVTFALDKSAKAIGQLKAENEKLKEQLQAARQQEKMAAELVEERNIRESLLKEKEQELEAKTNELKGLAEELESIKNDCNSKHSEFESALSKNAELEEKLSMSEQALDEANQELEEESSKLTKAQESLHSTQSELEAALNAKAGFEDEIKALEQDAYEKENEASTKLKKVSEALEELKQSEEQKRNELKASQLKVEELTNQVSKKEAELEAAKAHNESEISKLKDEATALKKKINETDSVNVNLSKSLDITTKQNLKLQVDLDDLRERFANSKENEARLKALISDLHEKLQKAANFYHRLEKTNPELLSQSDE